MNLQPGTYLPGGPIRNWQFIAIFLPFLVPLLLPLQVWIVPLQIGSWLLTAFALLLV